MASAAARWGREQPEAVAVRSEGGVTTYGELDALAGAAAARFATLGVGFGDRVALLLGNGEPFIVAYLGALRLGAIATSVSISWPVEDVASALACAAPRVLVTEAAIAAALGERNALPDCAIVLVDDGGWLRGPAPFTQVARVRGDTPAAILFTSGTTGTPKGVTLSHDNVRHNATAKVHYTGVTPRDRISLLTPLAHCFAQNAVLNTAFRAGASVALAARFDVEWLERATRDGMTMLMAPPSVFARALAAGVAPRLRGLRHSLSAADVLSMDVRREWRATTGQPIHEAYGLTESSPFATYHDRSVGDGDGVGCAIAGVDVRTVDESGVVLGEGEPGEVQLRGHNVMLGYWGDPIATAAALDGGWLRTGDVGRLEAKGSLVLEGRRDDLVKVNGFRVHPSVVERALAAHPAVAEVAAFAMPTAGGDTRLGATVVLRRDASPVDEAALIAWCRAQLPGYATPARIATRGALPRTSSGKIRRALLARDVEPSPALTSLVR